MTEELRLNHAGVEECIKRMGDYISELQETAKQIDSVIINNLGEYWSGNSYNKTISTYQENYQQLLTQQIPQMVQELADYMQTCKVNLEAADEELAGQ